ncbi:MAG: hypothetical protein RIC19_02120 [Phaeodactylibacter sp.]|uniref:hypothetical protein n=1 Tax=Phaeodactylibacter sp. TaxID=1940289 RepID=UPI0032EE1D65
MPAQNETLITLLRDIHQSCISKLQNIQSTDTEEGTRLSETQAQIAQLEKDFNNEALWAHAVEYDNHELLQAIVAVKMAPETETGHFLDKVEHLLLFLKDNLLSKLQAFSNQADTSVWNQKMLDELLKVRRALRQTKSTLTEAGHDLESDEELIILEESFTLLLADYRKHLRENSVQSNEDHIRLMQLLSDLIKSAGTVADFKSAYQTLNDFVERQIPSNEKEDS